MWNFSENVCFESLCWTRNINFEMPSINIHARCKVLAKEAGLVILERQMHSSAGGHQWVTEPLCCKTGNLLTEPWHHGLACVTYLSHFSGSCGIFWSPPSSHLKGMSCYENRDMKFTWQGLMILTHAKHSSFQKLGLNKLKLFRVWTCSLSLGRWKGGAWGKPTHLWELP